MKLSFVLVALLATALPTKVLAQGQDSNHQWVGNSIADFINSSEEDMKTVYLYNVGTGKYLNIGSNWGTSVSAYNVGMPIVLTDQGSGTYLIQGSLATSDGQYLGFPNPPSTPTAANKSDWDRVYCDRKQENSNLSWTISETGSNSKTYTLYCYNGTGAAMGGNRYLIVSDEASSSNRLELVYPTAIGSYGQNAEWKFITLKDMKNAFKAQFASNEAPADATFLIKDQDMNRSNKDVDKWTVSGFNYRMNGSYSFLQDAQYTYYVGMGQRPDVNDDYQRQYGNYWIGSIRNLGQDAHANGTLTQAVTTLKKGWYRVSCDGFYHTDGSMKSSLFAYVEGSSEGQSNVSTKLNLFNEEFEYDAESLTKVYKAADASTGSPYVRAAKLFETGTYNNSILVYVPENGKVLNIGIKVEGSADELDWTAFDNFQLKYCGDNDMVLDETQTSLDYLTKQGLSTGNAYTLILKRTMTSGLWNSITLPVALTAAQFKTAFGDQANLAKLKGQDENIPTRIDFESVSLANDAAIVIEPNQLYIMRPTRNANVTTGSYNKTLNDHSTITVNAPYFTINNVVPTASPTETFKENSKPTTTEADNIQFCGTQVSQQTAFVPAGSYVLGNNGKWYHTQSPLSIKGFRCWIATNVASGAKALTFALDGEEQGSITGIEGIRSDIAAGQKLSGDIYGINGQLVRRGTSSLEGLPKGIYIVNNKKYVIK
ncbi:adhesin [Prevotella sp. KH2C16]|uniref:adhesin n=1 Tax=Prevotella sp. KH2C16 TaxID=1855325 RepID=UPI0015A5E23B|nr:adhesin [Prevotella sp. KH2C16]